MKEKEDKKTMKTLRLLTIAMALMCTFALRGEKQDEKFYKNLLTEDISKLFGKGTSLIQTHPDSSAIYFTAVTARYDPKMTKEEKITVARAFNNLGYINFFNFGKTVDAYGQFLRAEDISKETGDGKVLPFIYINIANVFAVIDDYDSAMDFYRKSFQSSLSAKEYAMTLTSFSALVIQSFNKEEFHTISKEAEMFESVDIPDIPMARYTRLVYQGCKEISEGNEKEGARILQDAIDTIDTDLEHDRYLYSTIALLSYVAERKGNIRKAIDILREIPEEKMPLDIKVGVMDRFGKLYAAAGNPDSSAYFKLRYLELSDTMLRMDKMKAVHDIQTAHVASDMTMQLDAARHDLEMQKWTVRCIAIIIFIAAACGLRWWIYYRQLKKSHEVLYQKNRQLLANDAIQSLAMGHEPGPNDLIDDETALFLKITEVMEKAPEVTQAEFSIDRLASFVGESTKKVSKCINDKTGSNFSWLLQTYRVKEACRRLADKERYGGQTIEAISEGLGFKSRSNFTAVFKKITGLSPSQYQKMSERNKYNDFSSSNDVEE